MPRPTPLLILSIVVALLAYTFPPAFRSILAAVTTTLQKWSPSPASVSTDASSHDPDILVNKKSRMPVYFFSHGGPDVMYNKNHPVYPVLQRIGAEITSLKPSAVVVFSAHWQSRSPSAVHVNSAPSAPLIYDFSGFPDHYYHATYPNVGSPALASRICSLVSTSSSGGLSSSSSTSNFTCTTTHRGLDHGVWAGFHVAFDPETNPLSVPLVQVSLLGSEDPDAHYNLGRAVSALRDNNPNPNPEANDNDGNNNNNSNNNNDRGIIIIGAGMSVHNLHDMFSSSGGALDNPMPYAVSFDEALRDAVEAAPPERQEKMAAVCRRPDARQAHPWMDHLMPVHVAAGAAGDDDRGEQLWTLQEGSLAWAQYRFGSLPS